MAYEPLKAAQLVAAFVLKNGRHPLSVLKAMKLVYLADRESIKRYGFPILDEKRCSMPHGPVNSQTYNYVRGKARDSEGEQAWSSVLETPAKGGIRLKIPSLSLDDLEELSEADLACVEAVWAAHGKKTPTEIRNWTHDPANIPEWEDPGKSSVPIPFERIVKALNLPDMGAIVAAYSEMQAEEDHFDILRDKFLRYA